MDSKQKRGKRLERDSLWQRFAHEVLFEKINLARDSFVQAPNA